MMFIIIAFILLLVLLYFMAEEDKRTKEIYLWQLLLFILLGGGILYFIYNKTFNIILGYNGMGIIDILIFYSIFVLGGFLISLLRGFFLRISDIIIIYVLFIAILGLTKTLSLNDVFILYYMMIFAESYFIYMFINVIKLKKFSELEAIPSIQKIFYISFVLSIIIYLI